MVVDLTAVTVPQPVRSYTERMDSTPKRVLQTARGIQAIIDRGAPGDRLPSEVELARQMTVSRATVRDALNRLWVQGLVTRRWGAGTFISERHSLLNIPVSAVYLDTEELGSLPQMISNTGHLPSLTSFNSRVVLPPRWVTEEFQLQEGNTVRCLERCLAVDGRPAVVLRDHVPLRVHGMTLDLDRLRNLQFDFPTLCREAGVRLVKQAASMDATIPDHHVADLLGFPASKPVLHAEQRSYAETGETVICTDAYYSTEIFGNVLVRTIPN